CRHVERATHFFVGIKEVQPGMPIKVIDHLEERIRTQFVARVENPKPLAGRPREELSPVILAIDIRCDHFYSVVARSTSAQLSERAALGCAWDRDEKFPGIVDLAGKRVNGIGQRL